MKKITLQVESGFDITSTLQEEIYRNADDSILITIPEGDYIISDTVKILDNTHLVGVGDFSTRIMLADKTNNNMFTNNDYIKGNYNISVKNIWLEGNSSNQFKPDNEKRVVYCNFFYFKSCSYLSFSNIKATDCKQTVLHFNGGLNIKIDKLDAREMGWSGISTSGTDNITATDIYIYDSGKDIMHSGVHFDGGVGSYFKGVVEKCTGNGVMVDSKFCTFSNSVIQAECTDCKRGVSLLGDHNNLLSNVLIQNTKVINSETGIIVSNSKNVFITNCNIEKSSQYGVLLQGKFGGCDTVIVDTKFKDNNIDVDELHVSENNYFTYNNVNLKSKSSVVKENKRPQHKPCVDQHTGICSVCGELSTFSYFDKSVREAYQCKKCRASLRHRGQAQAIIDLYGDNVNSIRELSKQESFRTLTIYEPGIIGPLRKYFSDFPNYSQSYYWEAVSLTGVKGKIEKYLPSLLQRNVALGGFRGDIQNQNLESLTFADSSIDLLITADIFEHIRKPWKAFSEVYRVLKSGGRHIFTVPTQYPLPKKTIYRVDTSSDEDVYILPKRYHIAGDAGKSLVYTEFGADMLERLSEIGLETVYVFADKSNELRMKNITFVSTKK